MKKKKIRIAVTGAAGQMGYSLLFRIASGQMFGSDTEVEMRLLELESALAPLKGIVMELEDCAFPLLSAVVQTVDAMAAFKDADWIFLIGAAPRKAGMERSGLLKINSRIFIEQGKAISEKAKNTCKILTVGNPCNTNAFLVKAMAKNISPRNFFALTMLDQNRASAQLASKAGVSVGEIDNLAVWGNHSATQYPDFYNATIKGMPVTDIILEEEWLKTDFIKFIQQRGVKIIKERGCSSAASAANAIIDTVKNLTEPSRDGAFFSVAVSSDGSYGIEEGIMFSYPVQSDGREWKIVQGIHHNDFAREKISRTHKELLYERDAVKGMY